MKRRQFLSCAAAAIPGFDLLANKKSADEIDGLQYFSHIQNTRQEQPPMDDKPMGVFVQSIPIMTVDCPIHPDRNDRRNSAVYPRSVIEKAISQHNDIPNRNAVPKEQEGPKRSMFATLGYNRDRIPYNRWPSFDNVVAEVLKIELVGDIVWADLRWMETPSRLRMTHREKKNISFAEASFRIHQKFDLRPSGAGFTEPFNYKNSKMLMQTYPITSRLIFHVTSFAFSYLAFIPKGMKNE